MMGENPIEHLWNVIKLSENSPPTQNDISSFIAALPISSSNKRIWQILNYLLTHSLLIPTLKMHPFLLLMAQQPHDHSSLKHLSIFYFNLLHSQHQYLSEEHIVCVLGYLLAHHHQEQPIQCLQWLSYIFEELSRRAWSTSIFELARRYCPASLCHLLNMYGHYLAAVVDQRSTTELVKGFGCLLPEITKMYSQPIKLKIALTETDIMCLAELFHCNLGVFFCSIKNKSQSEANRVLQEVIYILNSVLFLGGYTGRLQDLIGRVFLEDVLSYLQVSFLVCRQEGNVKILMESVSGRLEQMLGVDKLTDIPFKKIIQPGQLASILRLLTNLVHIHPSNARAFENNRKYLHIIFSLCHDSVREVTMKEWAILFIRNVSEFSEVLREEIARVKITLKVDE